jgi:proteasome accessory factor C
LRLTAPEGLALVAAARAILGMPVAGDEKPNALASAVAKLETVLGAGGDDQLEIELGAASPAVLGALQTAVAQGRKVLLDYYSFGRDETGTRVVRPWRVFSSEGHWYLLAWCEKVGAKRLFRVDRARTATVLAEHFDPPEDLGPVPLYESRSEDPVVTLDLAPGAHWVVERYPHEGTVDMGEGVLRARLRVSSRAWLERLLLRAGPAATVVSGADGVAASAARRILTTYGHVTSRSDPD